MNFAGKYLLKQNFSPAVNNTPEQNCGIIIVIPCFNEPDIINTLDSLRKCYKTKCAVETIVVINHAEDSEKHAKKQNELTAIEISNWKEKYQTKKFKIHTIIKKDINKKLAGAGYARKTGMDEAVFRFNLINNPDGIIVSLDADCICENNYITEIEKHFNNNKTDGCSIYFEHPVSGTLNKDIYEAVILYELYLRYYKNALKTTGYPYAYHTIGSCFCVKAGVYCQQGGMNKRNAGEDFYFIQKIIQLGNFSELNTTRVIPSPRPSLRVVFGTGPAIHKLIQQKNKVLETYNLKSFLDMKYIFYNIEKLYKTSTKHTEEFIDNMPPVLKEFCKQNNFLKNIIDDANNNSKNIHNFKKRFFRHFNAFKILKYLNFSHNNCYKHQNILQEAAKLNMYLNNIPKFPTRNLPPLEILKIYRDIDRKNHLSGF